MTAPLDRLPPNPKGLWEFTSENGSRILWDYDLGWSDPDDRDRDEAEWEADEHGHETWMRIPAVHPDGTVNRSKFDGRWCRAGWTPHAPAEGDSDRTVRVGQPIIVGEGLRDTWLTTPLVAIRPLSDDEAPSPSLPILDERLDSPRFTWRFQHDCPVSASGDDLVSVTEVLADELDEWLEEQARRVSGPPCRTARWWIKQIEAQGSLSAALEARIREALHD